VLAVPHTGAVSTHVEASATVHCTHCPLPPRSHAGVSGEPAHCALPLHVLAASGAKLEFVTLHATRIPPK
jgi:hypothetical protein